MSEISKVNPVLFNYVACKKEVEHKDYYNFLFILDIK